MRAGADRREILRLAVPALGALAAEPLVSLVDTAFVSRLGTIPLAALGVDAAILGLAFVAFNFLQYGVTPLIGGAFGRGDLPAVDRGARHALVLGWGVGVLMAALVVVLSRPLLSLMSTPAEAVPDALTYLRVRALSGPFVMTVMVGHGVFRGLQDTGTPLRITLGFSAVNLILDPLLIFGFDWGVTGAAWASVAAQGVGAAWFVARLRSVGISPLGPVHRGELLALVRVGLDLLMRTASLVLTLTVAARVAATLGTPVVAAHQVAVQIFLVLGLAIDSLAIAGQSAVSMRLGAGDVTGARTFGLRLLRWGGSAGAIVGVALYLLRTTIAGAFAPDPETEVALVTFLTWVAVLMVPGSLVFVWDGLYLGASRFRFLAVTTSVAAAVSIGYLTTLPAVPFGRGVHQVWAGILLLVVIRGIPQAWDYARAGGSVAVE